MSNVPLYIASLVVVLGVLISIHEFGHFIMAKWMGFPVEVFSLGFGKRLFGFQRGGTDYRVSLIPLGGYVKIIGLGPDESTVAEGDQALPPAGPRWQRFVILVMGPAMNLLLAIGVIAVLLMIGMEVPKEQIEGVVVGIVPPGSAASRAGFQAGDRIVAVNENEVERWQEVDDVMLTSPEQPVAVEVERGGRPFALVITPAKDPKSEIGDSGLMPLYHPSLVEVESGMPAALAGLRPDDIVAAIDGIAINDSRELMERLQKTAGATVVLTVERNGKTLSVPTAAVNKGGTWRIGVKLGAATEMRRLGPLAALVESCRQNWRMTRITFEILGNMFKGKMSFKQLSGPIDIAKESGKAAQSGWHASLQFLAMISLQLGIMNLLPIPILDGGNIFVLLIEGAARRDLPLRVKERILQFGLLFLLLLMTVVIFNDIRKNLPQKLPVRQHSRLAEPRTPERSSPKSRATVPRGRTLANPEPTQV